MNNSSNADNSGVDCSHTAGGGAALGFHETVDVSVEGATEATSAVKEDLGTAVTSDEGGRDNVPHIRAGSCSDSKFNGGTMGATGVGESGTCNASGGGGASGRALARSASCSFNDESRVKHRTSEQAYEEMENYLQRAQDEINATFGEDSAHSPLVCSKSTKRSPSSPPRARKVFQQLPLKSPPLHRKSRHHSPKRLSPNFPSSPKLTGSPKIRKKSPARKFFPQRRVSSPALRSSWRDQHLQTWSQSLLKDFDAIVQEQICKLSSNKTTLPITSSSNSGAHLEKINENDVNFKRKFTEHNPSFLPIGGQNSLPPKPPNRNPQSKACVQIRNIEKETSQRNFELRKCFSNCEDFRKLHNFNRSHSLLPATQRQKSLSYAGMGASSSNLGPGDCPGLYGTLPRNRRRVSLGINSLSIYSPEHPDAPASPCQLVRVGPRLSRSHSLDEAFVPLSQKTYFVPTPSTPAATPLLKKEKFQDKNRRKGVCDAPKIPISLFDLRRASTSTQGNSISSNNLNMNRDYHNGRHSIPGYGKNAIGFHDTNELKTCDLDTIGRYSKSGRIEDKRLLNPSHEGGNRPFASKMLTLPDQSRVGRKSEPYLPAYCVLPVQYLDGRRHTLPVRPVQSLNVPPAFNTTSWDALPPAEEVEVMEDKPLQMPGVKYLSYPTSGIAVSDVLRKGDRKHSSVPPALEISFTSSYSVNSSLSSLSAVSCSDAVGEFDSTVVAPTASHSRPAASFPIVNTTASHTPACNPNDEAHFLDAIAHDSKKELAAPRPKILGDANSTDGPSPVSSPEPISAKLQLRPLKEESAEKDFQFSVTVPENHKRKKRKVKPKRYSDTCLLVRKARRSKRVTRNRSAACNFAKPSRDHAWSDDSSPERDDNTEFLRYCFDHLKISQSGRGKQKLLGDGRQNLRNASDSNILQCNSEISSRDKMVRRSWSMDVVKKAPTLRSSRSAKDVSYRKAVVGEEASREFLKQVVIRIPKSRIADVNEGPHDGKKPGTSANKSCSVSTQTCVANISPAASTCWTSDIVSLDPYASSIGFSATEDDLDADGGDEQEDDSDTDEGGDGWWAESFSSSSPRTPATPTSPARRNSSPSLSESLDTLDDLNEESGLGTTSTRPSVSPPPQASFLSSSPPQPTENLPASIHRNMERSTSNLSSEDTGVDVTINRKVRRTLSSRRAREILFNPKIGNARISDPRTIRVVATCDRETQTEEMGLHLNDQGNNYRIKSFGMLESTSACSSSKVQNIQAQRRSSGELSTPLTTSTVGTLEDYNRLTNSEPRLTSIQCKPSPSTTPKLALKVCYSDASLSIKNRLGNTLPVLKENFISAVGHDQTSSLARPPPLPPKQKHVYASPENFREMHFRKESPAARPTQLTISPCYDPQPDSDLEILKLEPDSCFFGSTRHTEARNKNPKAMNSPSYSLQNPSPIATCTLPFPQNTCFGSAYFFDSPRQNPVPFSTALSSSSIGGTSSVPAPSYVRASGIPVQQLPLSTGPPTKATSTPSLASHGRNDQPATVSSAASSTNVAPIAKGPPQRATSHKELAGEYNDMTQ